MAPEEHYQGINTRLSAILSSAAPEPLLSLGHPPKRSRRSSLPRLKAMFFSKSLAEFIPARSPFPSAESEETLSPSHVIPKHYPEKSSKSDNFHAAPETGSYEGLTRALSSDAQNHSHSSTAPGTVPKYACSHSLPPISQTFLRAIKAFKAKKGRKRKRDREHPLRSRPRQGSLS